MQHLIFDKAGIPGTPQYIKTEAHWFLDLAISHIIMRSCIYVAYLLIHRLNCVKQMITHSTAVWA
jgi:hypothetical protein